MHIYFTDRKAGPGNKRVSLEFRDYATDLNYFSTYDVVLIKRKNEAWLGTVESVSKPARWVMQVNVHTYLRDGQERTRFKPKLMRFGNRGDTDFHKLGGESEAFAQSNRAEMEERAKRLRAEKRRRRLEAARTWNEVAKSAAEKPSFMLELGVNSDTSARDFTRIKLQVYTEFHPDKRIQNDKFSPEEFDKISKKKLTALAELKQYIERRDNVQLR